MDPLYFCTLVFFFEQVQEFKALSLRRTRTFDVRSLPIQHSQEVEVVEVVVEVEEEEQVVGVGVMATTM